MGMDQRVTFAGEGGPAWEVVRELLASHGYTVQVHMIDGELAFPDEQPPDGWRELRIGTPQGMVTARRDTDAVLLVTWGNADAAMRQAWNALTWAFAEAGAGMVASTQGAVSPADYRDRADLPSSLRR